MQIPELCLSSTDLILWGGGLGICILTNALGVPPHPPLGVFLSLKNPPKFVWLVWLSWC